MSIRKMYQIIDIDPSYEEVIARYGQESAIYAKATLMADGVEHNSALEIDRVVKTAKSAGTHICAGIVEVDAGSRTEHFVGLLSVGTEKVDGGVIYIRRKDD